MIAAAAAAADDDEPKWFAEWEDELPSPEELMPLSQTLITSHLALAFDILTPNNNSNHASNSNSNSNPAPQTPSLLHHHHHHLQSDFASGDLSSTGPGASATNASGGGDESARTLKRPRLVWTPQLHKRFVDAVAHLGIKNAVPKTIMQLMSVDGLSRENVASHLQKYRLYLKRMQGIGSSSAAAGPMSGADAATDHLFATGPIPHHFLSRTGNGLAGPGGHGTESFVPFVPMAALQQHHQQMAAAAAAAAAQQQFYQQRQQQHQIGHGAGAGGGFDYGFLSRALPQAGLNRMGPGGLNSIAQPMQQAPAMAASYVHDLEEKGGGGSRKVLTLFPTGED